MYKTQIVDISNYPGKLDEPTGRTRVLNERELVCIGDQILHGWRRYIIYIQELNPM